MSRWTSTDIPDQSGRTVVVTGGNAGLGLAVAHSLAARGAHVVLACRNMAKADAAARSILAASPGARVDTVALDLSSLDSVRTCADDLGHRLDRLDALVNNAGLMAVDESRTSEGFETQFGVNHLGHFALTAHLMPALLATAGSRVATMSSMGHRRGLMDFADLMFDRRGYQRWNAYFASKLANLLFTAELDRRLRAAGAGTIAVAAHPGAARTDLGTEGHGVTNMLMSRVVPLFTQPVAIGALGMLRAVTDPQVAGGEFYGPRFLVIGHPVRETPSGRARDAVDAGRLWEISAELVGVEPLVAPATS